MSTSSTSSAAHSRSTCRPIRSSACGREDIELLPVRNKQGSMIPLGTMVTIEPSVGPSLLSLYNLYPSSTVLGLPATGFSSGEAMTLMEQMAAKVLPPGRATNGPRCPTRRSSSANRSTIIFALAMLLVYLVLAGQYESWWMPRRGAAGRAAVAVGAGRGAQGTGHRQQSLYPDRARAADCAVGQERHPDRGSGARAARVRGQAAARGGARGGARRASVRSS